jgi:hypothetical protein
MHDGHLIILKLESQEACRGCNQMHFKLHQFISHNNVTKKTHIVVLNQLTRARYSSSIF